jgi:hypothetical protein
LLEWRVTGAAIRPKDQVVSKGIVLLSKTGTMQYLPSMSDDLDTI